MRLAVAALFVSITLSNTVLIMVNAHKLHGMQIVITEVVTNMVRITDLWQKKHLPKDASK